MRINFFYTLLVISCLSVSCQMTKDDFDSGKAQDIAMRTASESSVLDVIDNVVDEEEEKARAHRREAMEELTSGYSNLPSSADVTDYIDDQLSGNLQDCDPGTRAATTTPNRAHILGKGSLGARQVLATIYQSCEAIDTVMDQTTPRLSGVSTQQAVLAYNGQNFRQRVINNRTAMVNSHIVLSKLDADPSFPAEGCIDTTKQPPVYGYGSRKGLRREEINLFTRGEGVAANGVRASGIDCSEFISAAFAAEGLKFRTNETDFNSFTTSSLHDISVGPTSCIAPVEFNLPQTIASGDVINLASSHVIMVDTVGDDPLGIRKYSSTNDCNSITISDFDFTYIHSGALNNYGPARVDAKIHAASPDTMFRNLLIQARAACHNVVAGNEKSSRQRTSRFSILRHESSNPACYYDEPAKLKGGQCVQQCLEQRILHEH